MQHDAIFFSSSTFDFESWKTTFNDLSSDRTLTLDADIKTKYAVLWKHHHGALKDLKNLKVIFSLGAGVDHILDDPTLPDVPIVRAISDNLTHRMSEYVVWQVLDHHRKGMTYRAAQSQKMWANLGYQPAAHEIEVGILGLGELGADAAHKVKHLGFDASGWSRSQKQLPGVRCYSGEDGLKDFLSHQDILVVLLPHTPQTEGFLNEAFFAKLKKNGPLGKPILINAGRGALQVESDLIKALDEGLLGAASLDVFETEPLSNQSLLWQHPRVTITPHIAADSDPKAILRDIIQQISNFEAGGVLENVVDRSKGY